MKTRAEKWTTQLDNSGEKGEWKPKGRRDQMMAEIIFFLLFFCSKSTSCSGARVAPEEKCAACPKLKERSWVFKVDWWTYFKGAYSGPSSHVHLSLGFFYFQCEANESGTGKGFSAGSQWGMIRDYFRMKINDKVQAVREEREPRQQEGGEGGRGGAEACDLT